MPKVSVIISVHNIEKYICQCLDSIVNQTLKDIEIICVDDASSDNSYEILKKYKAKDSRIIILRHGKNLGLSAARNSGLLKANGKYVYFMDGDDLLDLEALEVCYNECEENQLDVLTFDAEVFLDKDFSDDISIDVKDFDYDRILSLEPYKKFPGNDFFYFAVKANAFKSSACLSFINKELLKNNKLSFYPGIIYEDQIFTIQLYFAANKIMYYPRKFFKRRIRENSIMTKKVYHKNIHDILIISEEILKISEEEKNRKVKKILRQYVFSLIRWMEDLMNKITDEQELEQVAFELGKSGIWLQYLLNKKMEILKTKIKKIIKNFTMFISLFTILQS